MQPVSTCAQVPRFRLQNWTVCVNERQQGLPVAHERTAARCPGLHRVAFAVIIALVAGVGWPRDVSAQYLPRQSFITNGAITFTGNSLGLDANNNQNAEGTRGSIGTFITVNGALQDLTPPPPGGSTPFPLGTTSDWTLNSSAATCGCRRAHVCFTPNWCGAAAGRATGPARASKRFSMAR